MIEVKIINKSKNPMPQYETIGSAAVDLRADLGEKPLTVIRSGERMLVHTGLYIQLPVGYEAQVRPRSGLALKHGISIVNSPGTIDSDYRGEIGIIIINHGDTPFTIKNGDRIAQMAIQQVEQAKFIEADKLDETERGEGGFGHTGKA